MSSTEIILFPLAYLLGSIPFGLLIGRARGIDIREQGSGNIGATNVFRCVGKTWGTAAFLLDFFKGYGAAGLLPLLVNLTENGSLTANAPLFCGVCAIIGHNYPVFLKFKGGKGIATSTGVLVGVAPQVILPAMVAWLVLLLSTRYVSVASMGAAVVVALCGWLFYRDAGAIPWALTLLAALAVWRHRSNLKRLVRGEENRFDLSKKQKNTDEAGQDE